MPKHVDWSIRDHGVPAVVLILRKCGHCFAPEAECECEPEVCS